MVNAMAQITLKANGKKLAYQKDLLDPIAKNDSRRYMPYRGLLNSPSDEEWTKEECFRKFSMLFEHYEIDGDSPGGHLQLALKLALDWVPGFVVTDKKPKRGAPALNDLESLIKLAREIDTIWATAPTKTKKWACSKFLESEKANARWKDKHVRTVENYYDIGKPKLETRKKLVEALQTQPSFGVFGASNIGGLMRLGGAVIKHGLLKPSLENPSSNASKGLSGLPEPTEKKV